MRGPDRARVRTAHWFVLVMVHPAACDGSREKNGRDVRSEHSQKDYAINEQHLNPKT